MKLTYLLFAFIFIFLRVYSQEESSQIYRNYELTGNTLLSKCNELGDTGAFSDEVVSVPGTSKFTVVRKLEITEEIKEGTSKKVEYFIVKFWDWKDPVKKGLYNIDANGVEIYFRLTQDELNSYTFKLVRTLESVAGTMAYPFKFRNSNGLVFTKDVALTGLGGLKINLNRSGSLSLSVVTGIGLSSVTLDSLNTNGLVSGSEERAAATIPFGFLIQYDKLQLGITSGVDLLTATSRDGWEYHGKPWLAIGIGFSIFNNEKKSAKEPGKN